MAMIPIGCRVGLLIACLLISGPASAAGDKLMVLMQEKVMGAFGKDGYEVPGQTEMTLISHFQGLGYDVVDPQVVRTNMDRTKGMRLLAADDKGAAALGLQVGARYAVMGTAISKPSGSKLLGTQMKTIQATITARVVDNDTARVIATATATASKVHIDEVQGGTLALQEAAGSLASTLSGQLSQHDATSQMAVGSGQTVLVNVAGLASYRHLDFIMRYFETEMVGSQGATLSSFNSGIAEVNIAHPGGGTAIASAVSRKKFKGFRLEPNYVAAGRIDIQVVLNK